MNHGADAVTKVGRVVGIAERNHARKGRLTPFQAVFCKEYMLDHSAKEAYLRAGGHAEKPGNAAAQQMTRGPVKAEIARLEAVFAKDYQLRRDAVALEEDWIIAEAKRQVAFAGDRLGVFDKLRRLDRERERILWALEDMS